MTQIPEIEVTPQENRERRNIEYLFNDLRQQLAQDIMAEETPAEELLSSEIDQRPGWLVVIEEQDEAIELVDKPETINIVAIKYILQLLKEVRPPMSVPFIETNYLHRAQLEEWAKSVIFLVNKISHTNRLCVPERECARAGLTPAVVNYFTRDSAFTARIATFGEENKFNTNVMSVFASKN